MDIYLGNHDAKDIPCGCGGGQLRESERICFDWYFYHGEKEQTPGETGTEGYDRVQVPHDWSLSYPFDQGAASCGSGGYVETGIGWYRKLFRVDKKEDGDEKIFLRFEGVYMQARVWLNGRELGSHVYGYTPFEWEITDFLKAQEVNVLDVRVDNSAQPNSRWYSGSGITRDVWLYRVKRDHILPYGLWVRTPEVSGEQALVRVEAGFLASEKSLLDGESFEIETILYTPEGDLLVSQKDRAEQREAQAGQDASPVHKFTLAQDFVLDSPLLWDIDNPHLYEVVARLCRGGQPVDELRVRTGLRSIDFRADTGFWLNGRQCKINGVCVHHDGGCVGAAVPPQIWERRLKKLKEMGVNAIRMSHNPPDIALLDLCDEMGFLVMDESFDEWRILKNKEAGSNTHESRGYSEWFEACHEEDLRTMLLRDRNHPCIVIWSIGNEVPDQTKEDGYLTARHLKEICRELDPDRLITQANDQIRAEPAPARESFLNELDVVGYNYAGRWRERAETFYDEDKRAHPGWRIIGTENGGVGGIRGEYPLGMKENAGWWKHPYYSAPVEVGKLLRYTMSHDYVAGDFMWTGIDYLGEAHWPERSASAGVLDTCGFEKDSFYFYKSIWRRTEPMVYLFPHWNLEAEEGTILPVLCFTNCESAELFLNGKSYGKKAYAYPAYGMTQRYGHFDKTPIPLNTGDLFLSWDVPYEPGCIEVVGYRNGQASARYSVRTAGEPALIRGESYCSELKADGRQAGQIEVSIFDRDGNFCYQADTELIVEVEGTARLLGVDNGNPANTQSMRGSKIRAFHGRAFIVVQSDARSGECQVSITAKGLGESIVRLTFV